MQVVIHDGLKYYTCCKSKTCDWDNFKEQIGFATATCHKWKKPTSEVETSNCNPEKPNDWHQTNNNVVLVIYANALTSKFSLNRVSLECYVEYDSGKKYKAAFELDGVVRVEDSKVVISGTLK